MNWQKVKKQAHFALYILLTAVLFIGIFTPFVGWIIEPELTKMQIFLKYWWASGISMIAAFIIIALKDK
jgi:hypothetical protein